MHRQKNRRIPEPHGVFRIGAALPNQFGGPSAEAQVVREIGLPHETQPPNWIEFAVVRPHAVAPLVVADRIDHQRIEIVEESQRFAVMSIVAESGTALGVADVRYRLWAEAVHIIDQPLVCRFLRCAVRHFAQERHVVRIAGGSLRLERRVKSVSVKKRNLIVSIFWCINSTNECQFV